MNFPCPNKVDCPGTDLPISNYSAEGPDSPFWIGFSGGWWPGNKPRVGTPWKNPDGFVYCLSTQGQADANLCANNSFPEQWGSNGISGDPTRPGDGGSGGIPTYGSDEQRCIYTCPDGTQFVWTVAAGYARATNRAQADAIANSLACRLAIAHKICLSNLDNKTACASVGYFGTIKASIGVLAKLPLTWSIVSGNLPPGVDLDPDTSGDPNLTKTVGLIGSVDPSASGDYTFTLRATDADGNYLQKTFTISIITFTNGPSQATVGTFYSFQFTAAGGTPPYTFSVPPGHLPSGLTMSDSGLITGTPTDTIPTTFTVTVKDSSGGSCSKQFTMTANASTTCPADLLAIIWQAPSFQHGTFSISGPNGSISNSWPHQFPDDGAFVTVSGTITNSGAVDYDITATVHWQITTENGTSSCTFEFKADAAFVVFNPGQGGNFNLSQNGVFTVPAGQTVTLLWDVSMDGGQFNFGSASATLALTCNP